MSSSETISPTAHYTGYVWARNGLSHPELETLTGRLMFESLQPIMRVRRLLRQGSLEEYLLARHRAIDLLLERAIEQDGITQVIEIASGLSPRGWRFIQRYGGDIVYVETDLPGMADQKRRALERMGSLSENHRVVELDALADGGPHSLDAVAGQLEAARGLVIIAEGLVGYLPKEGTEQMWRRFATTLRGFQSGRHICHIHLRNVDVLQAEVLSLLLSLFVRTRVRVDYRDELEVEELMVESGFSEAHVYAASRLLDEPENQATRFAHVVEALA